MALIEWRDEYKIGIPSVDHEHRGLIELLNELHAGLQGGADKASVSRFLGEVHARIAAHFALEEKIMRDHRYDLYEDHKAEHERLLDEISDIAERYENGEYFDYEEVLARHLHGWFTAHFKAQDARLHKMLG
jgi:hemerythrin-like metal-binding protein